ncbi:MAG TPA: sensor domain-containing diguanylate cyclase [Gaiellales bacterium]|nr:sensor domain-containing diguanylate cyclase [Gaiellales bacterium]
MTDVSAALLRELLDLGLQMSAEPDLDQLFDLALAGAIRFTRAEGGAIYVTHADGLEIARVRNDLLARRYGLSELHGRFHGQRLPADGRSLAGYVAATATALNVPDAYAIPPTSPYHLYTRFDRENQYETRSVLALPLAVPPGTLLGVLQLVNATDAHDRVVAFDDQGVELVSLLAAYAAAAIRNLQLATYSMRDHLTGAFNRRYVLMRLDEEISRTLRTGEPLSLALVDIDHFKTINDQHGHPQGDAVIRGLAQLMMNQSRLYTVVGRYGGDEFIVLLPSTPNVGAQAYAERIRRIVERYPFAVGTITLSIGVATIPGDADGHDALIGAADQALYRAKQAGRNRVASLHNPVP